jgi:hypothetical protein
VDNGKDRNLLCQLVDLIDHDIRSFDQFARSLDQARPANMGQAGNNQAVYLRVDAADNFRCRFRAVLENPIEYLRRDRGPPPRGRKPSFAQAPSQPFVELLECQPACVWVRTATPDFFHLLVGESIGTFALRFHEHQNLCGILLTLARPFQHPIKDRFHLLFRHTGSIA